ncbi:MAG: methyl-accepting chemotaxis protein [Planctomycetaceae bacterium]|jgi:methyl-accepting chemotaxis protein|nr:methyl-accepting chemotaxis protein [Planctomycetaceae bacterium]
MKIFKGIQSKILVPVIFMTCLLVGVTLYTSTIKFQNFVQQSVDESILTTGREIKKEISMLRDLTLEQTKALSYRENMLAAVKNKDRDAIFKIFDDYESSKKCEFFTIIEPDGTVLARTANRQKYGDKLGQTESIKYALEQKKAGVFFESTPTIPLSIRGAAPILDAEGTLLGVLSSGFRIDTEAWVKHVQDEFGVENSIFVGHTCHVTTLSKSDGTSAVETQIITPEITKAIFEAKKEFFGESIVLGQPMKVFYYPFSSESGKILGILFAGFPIAHHASIIQNNIWSNLMIALIGLIFFVLLLWFIIRHIVGPIRQMTTAAQCLAEGGLEMGLNVRTGDELEILAGAFQQVASSLSEKTEVALTISKGDLRVWVPLNSVQDTLGHALIEMRYSFYDSIRDLKTVAGAISTEGDLLTQTNRRLVANTNESASQLKDVSSSISRVNTQTRQTADNARNAEMLANQAHTGTTEGQNKMNRMVDSMNGITKSSEEIKKIIRVIDDIAFQTNLLALNAAVEAARAGQHGKGFAVVAEEVRSLAARSAKAAKETAGLIEESIHQVNIGSRVASETSESLNSIAAQVNQVNEIIAKISHEAEEQTHSLDDVNSAVSQLSNTADENAVVVTEAADAVTSIATTAQNLNAIIKHFKVNEDGKVSKPTDWDKNHVLPSPKKSPS